MNGDVGSQDVSDVQRGRFKESAGTGRIVRDVKLHVFVMRHPVPPKKMGVITHAPSRHWRAFKERFQHARWGVLHTLSLIQKRQF